MKLALFILTVLLSVGAYPQGNNSKESAKKDKQRFDEYSKKGLIWQYDKFRDETVLMTKSQTVSGPDFLQSAAAAAANKPGLLPIIGMISAVTFKGNEVPASLPLPMIAFQLSGDEWSQLKSDREVRVMFNEGDIVTLGKASYEGEILRGSSLTTGETLALEIKPADADADSHNYAAQAMSVTR